MGEKSSSSRLVVFADDWGRHPSSCQHLVRHLLPRLDTVWINTLGTRRPRLSLTDFVRAAGRVHQWIRKGRGRAELPENLTVLNPHMYPGFRDNWQRQFNTRLLVGQINTALAAQWGQRDGRRVAVTTIPVTADLVGRLDVDRWVYYCVDDFSAWPGLDAAALQEMERKLVGEVDAVLAVSETLQQRIGTFGRDAELLTHGIDLEHWRPTPEVQLDLPSWWRKISGPVFLFWGLIDQRLDPQWCRSLAQAIVPRGGSLVLVGPKQYPDKNLASLPGVQMPGPIDYQHLPKLASAAQALVMPYADLEVTRAMQPLKFKEYLATGKPVLARDLPAMRPWSDATDLLGDTDTFVSRALERLSTGTPPEQQAARLRLIHESWSEKARQFEAFLQA